MLMMMMMLMLMMMVGGGGVEVEGVEGGVEGKVGVGGGVVVEE